MQCPNCGLFLAEPLPQWCPRCGASLQIAPPVQRPPVPSPAVSSARRRRLQIITYLVLAGIVLVCCGVGFALYLSKTPGKVTSAGLIFQDELSGNSQGWLVDNHCFFKDGSYDIVASYVCYAPAGSSHDANISVKVKQVAGPLDWFYGLVFRRASAGNWYEFEIDGNSKWRFAKIVNDTYSDILPYRLDIAINGGLNVTNTLLVQMKGSHFAFYVNGTKVGEADDTTFSSGLSGLLGNDNIQVAYNHFQITPPN